jgi:hypothetical protein
MAQYIDKDALVAEMKRRISNLEQLGDRKFIEIHFTEQFRFIKVYEGIIDFVNTLEVKEVDLDKYINKYFKGWYVDLTDQGNILHSPDGQAGLMSVKKVAKHFFELGLKTQKGK